MGKCFFLLFFWLLITFLGLKGFRLLTDFVMYFVGDLKEVFVDPERDESLIFELLELKLDVADNESATWFLQDLASEQDAEGAMVTNEHQLPLLFCFI